MASFRINTLFMLLAVSAVIAWRWRRPEFEIEPLLRGCEQGVVRQPIGRLMPVEEARTRLCSPPPNTVELAIGGVFSSYPWQCFWGGFSDAEFLRQQIAHGPMFVRRGDGTTFITGHFDRGLAGGAWRMFHESDQTWEAGRAAEGYRSGEWTKRNRDGVLIATVGYAIPSWLPSGDPLVFEVRPEQVPRRFRHGPAVFHRDTGIKLREGEYRGDRPHGAWRLYDDLGELAAEGEMRHGRRHGWWKLHQGGELRQQHYLDGRATPAPDAHRHALQQDFQGENLARALAAVRPLVLYGDTSADLLADAFEDPDAAWPVLLRILKELSLRRRAEEIADDAAAWPRLVERLQDARPRPDAATELVRSAACWLTSPPDAGPQPLAEVAAHLRDAYRIAHPSSGFITERELFHQTWSFLAETLTEAHMESVAVELLCQMRGPEALAALPEVAHYRVTGRGSLIRIHWVVARRHPDSKTTEEIWKRLADGRLR